MSIEFRKSSFEGFDVKFRFQSKMVGLMFKFELFQFDKSDHSGKDMITLGANGFGR